jgi:hypothetical protein
MVNVIASHINSDSYNYDVVFLCRGQFDCVGVFWYYVKDNYNKEEQSCCCVKESCSAIASVYVFTHVT